MARRDTVIAVDRRDFLKAIGAAACSGCSPRRVAFPEGELLGVSRTLGHQLRDGGFPAPDSKRRIHIAIAGAGVSGLSAAWAFARAGLEDFTVLELEQEAGGNSRAGRNSITAYPWGAHYLPIPTQESVAVRAMLAEFGVLRGDPAGPRPRYDELQLCHAPQERLYINGIWQEGLMPHTGASRNDLEQFSRFEDLMQSYKQRRDAQGRKAFAIPMAFSSRDPDLLALDRISFREYLLAQGLDSHFLHWYADYSCRDDYGTTAAQTSAWAGLHYFCCRDGEASNASPGSVLTWPEGNAWLTRRLAERAGSRLQTGAVVFRVEEKRDRVEMDVYHRGENRSERISADHVIWASPLFTLPRIQPDCPVDLVAAIGQLSHAPWLTANLTLHGMPARSSPGMVIAGGAPLSWDNVLYRTSSQGYVVATHQQMQVISNSTVLTYYRALADDQPASGRQRLLNTPWRVWAEDIMRELSVPHPDLPELVQRIDIWRNGHAMVRPTVGFVWGKARERILQPGRRLHLAHADLSGYSVFEEAQYRGILAAERVMRALSVKHSSLLA